MTKLRCPICEREIRGEPVEWPDFPFCSPRCRTIDLGRWLDEKYRLPAPPQDDEDSEEPT